MIVSTQTPRTRTSFLITGDLFEMKVENSSKVGRLRFFKEGNNKAQK